MRPWPFSIVSAARRSGGGPLSILAASEGEMIAEGFGDTRFQTRLILFVDEQVMAVSVPDMPADLALREDGVAKVSACRSR
jgi:hypothetical protein